MDVSLPVAPEGSRGQLIPYGFFNDATGFAAAATFLGKGYLQPQVVTVGNAFFGSNGSYNLFLANSDLRVPWSDRLYVDQVAMYAEWNDIESYQSGNPAFTGERAGSNSSSKNNFITAEGDDTFAFLRFKYLLPLGAGREVPPHEFRLRDGMLEPDSATGGKGWNPLETGRTLLEFRPFYRNQDFTDVDSGRASDNETAGFKFSIDYDNTDWYANPSRGSRQRLTWSVDPGWLDDEKSWNALQFRHSSFFDLGASRRALSRVLAFDVWTSHSPSWNDAKTDASGEQIFQRPPLFEGSTLGGLERQRGYAAFRYHDRSAINYTLEYRYTPQWNPLGKVPLLKRLYIPWWQWVGFAEIGRVHDSYDLADLHSSMKATVGGGIRALVYELVVRADFGFTEEGVNVQMFINQPF